ncbi:uncharacterized protein Z519_06509 [Cladophialophora bantiana CBS 173.52]|uniref:Major facilitator superfamily (MFS) profile domain-containing protein n=1 Tax=Cladophialophora bantiana (strain ATCC 10958 / CBS 173.52 / CDC B-1940 / NIH 8579) TaxID=1442370 RepID=A0A0D2G1P6_CLAB1|nr:uncharacterized protein Z519_06509 [Cladophialophora bantiana CBS 173.52]KIW92662.1 hypothetical protein Z519_06509 [Cladophialophora bantiana CBS 173.52]
MEKDISLETVERAEGQMGLSTPLTEDERRCERKLKMKLDFIILPLLSTVYFFAQMGRSDVGNAKIAGMDKELHLSSQQYSNIASIFNVGYLVFQLPGTLLVRKIGPPYQFGGAMMAWGMVTACTVAVHSYASLMVIRVFVGVCEAFVQGAVFYLSFWYPYNELATRGAIFFSTAALAGAFNGLIAYGVETDLQGANAWSAWRWLFLIEGILPIGWAFVVVTFLPPTPEKVRFFFSEEEKHLIVKRSRIAHNTGESKIRPKLILNVLIDPKFWMSVCIESATLFCLQSLSNFLPAILYGFGWSTIKSQLMSVVVYACAFVAIIFSARVSDKTSRRGLIIIANATVATLGYILLLTLKQPAGRFAGACIVAMGLYPNVVINLTWAASTNIGYTHRATATALINSIAQAVAISGNQAYVDPPYYRRGHAASLGMIGFEIVVATTMLFVLKHENEKKKREQHSEKAEEVRRKHTIDDVGNRHPDYFFTL